MNKNKKKQTLLNIIIILGILMFLGSTVMLVKNLWVYWEADKMNKDLRGYIIDLPPQDNSVSDTSDSAKNDDSSDNDRRSRDYSAFFEINPDFVGWLEIPNTDVDYPVVQGANNSKYLSTNFYGKYQQLGTIFLDYHAILQDNSSSDNLVLFGHHAKNGSYFGDLKKYKNIEYYKDHQFINFDTTFYQSEWVIVSIYSIDSEDNSEDSFKYIDYRDFNDENTFNSFKDEIQKRNYFTNEADLKYGDKFLTLSTCDYDFDGERLVITARKLRSDETHSKFINQQISVNSNRVMPKQWYKK